MLVAILAVALAIMPSPGASRRRRGSPHCPYSWLWSMNERDLVAGIENCTIAAGEFRHADHVRLAWIYLRDHSLLEAIARFTAALRRFAARQGAPEKYHETVTWAYMLLIHERMRRGEPQDWERFRAENADLFARNPSILDRYYARATLESDVAKRSFVLPDTGLRLLPP